MRKRPSTSALWITACASLALSAGVVCAQGAYAPNLPTHVTSVSVDSGPVAAPANGSGLQVVYSNTFASNSAWTRLTFGIVNLSGPLGTERASRVRITSLADGAQQWLDAESIAQWGNTSAYFNGPAVRLELLAWPGVVPSRISVIQIMGDEPDMVTVADLCPVGDDRTQSTDPRSVRVLGPNGLIGSGFMFNDTNRFFLTAGHVQPSSGSSVNYNVPPSTASGIIQFPPPQDQYAIDALSVQRRIDTQLRHHQPLRAVRSRQRLVLLRRLRQ